MSFITPGSGPVAEATEEQAVTNVTAFAEELPQFGVTVTSHDRKPSADYGEGRYVFTLHTEDGREIEIQMPGAPLDRVRKEWTRLYLDGSSGFWDFTLDSCKQRFE
ncbi:hypothetical protein F9278_04480 [Streptomyces phaeolivaceus]|uniref:Uncharacterized protein n=1 Tax=Streptomyces phaeolivaceus TaxID=2653200 RepID=A0A5P8JYT8_9ACTN|nr:hypothetical protein [Streptomyces phaeolivaceus]QFQ95567.1 hypothetical protein F9278_04480 [Streptomyces phaeolivaceus]